MLSPAPMRRVSAPGRAEQHEISSARSIVACEMSSAEHRAPSGQSCMSNGKPARAGTVLDTGANSALSGSWADSSLSGCVIRSATAVSNGLANGTDRRGGATRHARTYSPVGKRASAGRGGSSLANAG